jgi:hypothetical protein
MRKFKVIVASTIYYETTLTAHSEEDIREYFEKGAINFTEWKETDLDSNIESIEEVK